MEQKKKLFIPSNIEAEKQIFDGIGVVELTFIAGSFFVVLVITLILQVLLELSTSVVGLSILSSIGISYVLARKDNNNMSFLVLIISYFKYLSSVKDYKFKYKGKWL